LNLDGFPVSRPNPSARGGWQAVAQALPVLVPTGKFVGMGRQSLRYFYDGRGSVPVWRRDGDNAHTASPSEGFGRSGQRGDRGHELPKKPPVTQCLLEQLVAGSELLFNTHLTPPLLPPDSGQSHPAGCVVAPRRLRCDAD
jgi:hypothetical protein